MCVLLKIPRFFVNLWTQHLKLYSLVDKTYMADSRCRETTSPPFSGETAAVNRTRSEYTKSKLEIHFKLKCMFKIVCSVRCQIKKTAQCRRPRFAEALPLNSAMASAPGPHWGLAHLDLIIRCLLKLPNPALVFATLYAVHYGNSPDFSIHADL